ncbi:MAG: NAD(P)-binding domain-containing protein [Bacteroidales bacterium]|nr:NAD(P)-binding domain-containing protein [Bacteroidales bacterium]
MYFLRRCAVIGYGSWATTLVGQLTSNGKNVNWLVTNKDVERGILRDGHNPKYEVDLKLNRSKISIYSDINKAVDGCNVVILACPSAYLHSNLQQLNVSIKDKIIISAIKGIVPQGLTTVLEHIQDIYGVPYKNLGLISGPTHTEEVSRGRLSFLTAASDSDRTVKIIESLFSSDSLILTTSKDIFGIEYASVLKNIYAIAVGLALGTGYGENFISVLVADCAGEMAHFLESRFPFERDIHSAAYMGDLIVTCYSNYSRNRRLGLLIGRGNTVKSAMNEMTMIAEGYYSAECIHKVNQAHGISMPIVETVYDVLYRGENPREAIASLAKKLN